MQFSKLDDTEFPNLETASPYALKNTFDYTRWVPGTKVRLVNVLWDANYDNVVKFDSDAQRDAWFDGISDAYDLTLTANARMVPDGTIKLPLPYDVAARYNYLVVEIPIATSREALIQNETTLGARRWHFFVGDISYSAPNTTVVALQSDVWTNFINQSTVAYMMLARGHAPVASSDTDTYLANPIENNRYLLAPDVNYDDSSIVKRSDFIPIGNGTKWMCFASTVSRTHIDTVLGTVPSGSSSSFTDPTFSDTSDWYGYQLQVNGYQFGSPQGDYSSLRTDADPYLYPDWRTPNGVDVYAVPATDTTFLNDVVSICPTFLRTVQACFMVDASMITLFEKHELAGHDIWYVHSAESKLGDFALSKGDFGFDSNEQRFAKLYTYPYSSLEVSDNEGHTAEVRIENTGKISVQMITSVLYPILDCRVYLTGINGVGSQSYMWKSMEGTDIAREMPNGDWDKLRFDFDIPTYSLYMDAGTAWMLDNYSGSIENARRKALASYHDSVRSANGAYTNAVASANTGQQNAVAASSTAHTNANASAATGQTISNNAAQCASDNTDITISANNTNTSNADAESSAITVQANTEANNKVIAANGVNISTTSTQNETSIATTSATGVASMQTSTISGAINGAMMPAATGLGQMINAFAGAINGYETASIDAATANGNALTIANANEAITSATTDANNDMNAADVRQASYVTNTHNTFRDGANTTNNRALRSQADNTYDTSITNAQNLYNTQTANATRTDDTAQANANRTLSTSTTNATRSREVAILNAQENLKASQYGQETAYSDARRGAPIRLTEHSGDAKPWAFMTNGVEIRVRTQSDSAIAQTAAQFARYGYTLNQLWDVGDSGLKLMGNFTYWEATDVWVDVRNVASAQVGNDIARIFREGVTVWNDPVKIGKVGIYDN